MNVRPAAMEAEREWGKKSWRMTLLAEQTGVPGIEEDTRQKQGFSNHGTICLRNHGVRYQKADSGAPMNL